MENDKAFRPYRDLWDVALTHLMGGETSPGPSKYEGKNVWVMRHANSKLKVRVILYWVRRDSYHFDWRSSTKEEMLKDTYYGKHCCAE